MLRSALLRHCLLLVIAAVASGCNLVYSLGDYEAIDVGTAKGAGTASLVVTLPRVHGDALVLAAASIEAVPMTVSGGGLTWTKVSASQSHVPLAVWVAFHPSPIDSPIDVTVTWPVTQTRAAVQLTDWAGPTGVGSAGSNSGTSMEISTLPVTADADTVMVFAAAGAHAATIGPPSNDFTGFDPVSLEGTTDGTQLVTAYQPMPAGTVSTTWAYPSDKSWESVLIPFTK